MSESRRIKVSAIIPVYNVGRYIGRCIESLKAQTLSDIEFIFVDDCSADASMAAVEAWAKQDERVRILRNEQNLGAGPSRNCGIEVAQGDYLSFIDPDDWISPDFYEILYAAATANGGHNIAKGRCCKVDGSTGTIGEPEAKQNERIRKQLGRGTPLFRCFTYEHWTAIWRKSLFANPEVRYGLSVTAQDTTFQLKACYQTNDIVLVDDAYYYYVQLPLSATHRDFSVRTRGELDALEEKAVFLLRQGYNVHAAAYIRQQIDTLLRRFQNALGAGMVERSEIQAVVDGISGISSLIANTTASANGTQRLQKHALKRPLIVPGFRHPGEGEVRVSVILPVYNPGTGIRMCIESLRQQLLDGLEFIFVDDCSTDGSMAEVEAWAAEDDRVRILRNAENLGPGPSRNRGIEEARGDYLSFIDPDDYVSPSFHELLYAAATADGGHDIAKGRCIEIDAQGTESEERGKRTNRLIASRFSSRPLYLRFSSDHWTAIYKRTLFEDGSVRYGEYRKAEDSTFILRMCHKTDDIVIEPMATYYYFTQRKGSAVNRRDAQQLKYEIDGLGEKIAFFEESGFDANARRYLSGKLHFYLSNGFRSSHADPSIAGELGGVSRDLERVVESTPNAWFLRDDCRYRAFVEHHVLLPDIGFLPPGLKADGVAQWIAFVSTCPNASLADLDECARAMALYIEHLAGEGGFLKAYSQVAKQVHMLPPRQRGVLWLALNRHLASVRSFRSALGKIKRKVLGR